MESFFHETCFSNADNRVLDVLRTSVKHRPKRSGDGTSGSTLRLRDEKAITVEVAVAHAVCERGGEIFLRVVRRDGGDIVEVCLCQRAA